MAARILLPLCIIGVAMAFAQQPAPVKAGDAAPEIDWSKIIRSPDSAAYRPNLVGRYSIIRFSPNLTANARLIARWNELVAGRDAVQFLWIASEPAAHVEPFLAEHPLAGWLLLDEENKMARAFGCELFCDVAIDPAGKIVGFTSFIDARQMDAVLQGNAVAIARDADDDETFRALSGGKARLEAEPWRPDRIAKPDFPPSLEVHISPSTAKGTESSSAPDHWLMRGFALREIVAAVYEVNASRVILPKEMDNGAKFDVALVLPEPMSDAALHELIRQALEKQLKFTAARETRPMDVYVLTTLPGKTPRLSADGFGGSVASSYSIEFALPPGTPETPEAIHKAIEEMMKNQPAAALANYSGSGMTMQDFCRNLEDTFARPVIDETGLSGSYDIEVRGKAVGTEEFIRVLREQTGLVLTPDHRSVESLVLHPLP